MDSNGPRTPPVAASSSGGAEVPSTNVTVVGAGRMGREIALSYAIGGCDVTVMDRDPEALHAAERSTQAALAGLVDATALSRKEAGQCQDRLAFGADLATACRNAQVIQECVPEDLAVKQHVISQIEDAAPSDALIATNTSSIRLAEIAAPLQQPARLLGFHWISPAYVVPLVEVVVPEIADEAPIESALALMWRIGKVPIRVGDIAGFLVNRLQVAYRAIAIDLVEQGVASQRDIDRVVKYALAPRQYAFGMFRLSDLVVNAETSLKVSEYIYEQTDDSRYRPRDTMRAMVAEGRLGLSTGRGWYDYHPGIVENRPPQVGTTEAPDVQTARIETARDRAFLAVYQAQRSLEGEFDIFSDE